MCSHYFNGGTTFVCLLLTLFFQLQSVTSVKSDLRLNYYNESCPRAEEIIKEQVTDLYRREASIATSFLRFIFHDCAVEGCDGSLLLDVKGGVTTEKTANVSFGLRYFKFIDTVKTAVERECPETVSCADILVLSARDAVIKLGGPLIEMRTGRRDTTQSYASIVDKVMPHQDSNMSFVLSKFDSMGIDAEGLVALLGSHTVGRTHCKSFNDRLYPTVDPTINPKYANYLRDRRCSLRDSRKKNVTTYAKNDPITPMVFDNMYYKNLLRGMGLMQIDQELVSDCRTHPFVVKMADDNDYFFEQFSRALVILSENNPLTGDQGEVRKNCRFVNS